MNRTEFRAAVLVLLTCLSARVYAIDSWQDPSNRAVLRNDAMEARFQSGLLYRLKDLRTGEILLSIDPVKIPSKLSLFGKRQIDLSKCTSSTKATPTTAETQIRAPDGTECLLRWRIEAGSGDLILTTSVQSSEPVAEMRYLIFGCDIAKHKFVSVNSSGVGEQFRTPWIDRFIGDPEVESSPMSAPAPLVALFEGETSGWVIEGRDLRIGPSNIMSRGVGDSANVGLICHFAIPTRTPQMFEIRLRTYKGRWETAIDPYVEWMERDAGYTPIDKLPRERAWVKDVNIQAYVQLGDFAGLEELAKKVDPRRTFLGRFYGWRVHADILDLPEYQMSDMAKKWFRRAHDLGFHVGAGFSAFLVSANRPDLVERFREGFAEIGVDKDGKKLYHTLPPSPTPEIWEYYCTPALKSYRDCFVEHVKDAVEAGADVIYLDEAAWPCGKSVVDGMSSIQGVMELEKDILAKYPHVVIETEQFNPVAARYECFGLSQMFLGHPLGGYIFHRFIKIAPEGIVHGPTDAPYLDAFQSYGYIMPGVTKEQSWLDIAKAFQDYELAADYTLSPQAFEAFTADRSGGRVPVSVGEDARLFGYRGKNDVTAFYEKRNNKQGLVVYEPGKAPRWFGPRVTGISNWPGPGVLKEWVHSGGSDVEADWLLYDGQTQIGLNPKMTYRLDEKAIFPAERFHVTSVPDDFALDDRYPSYLRPGDVGKNGSFFKLMFFGHGEMRMFVPDDVRVFLDGREVSVDRTSKSATVSVATSKDQHANLTAFPKSDAEIAGKLRDAPWQVPPCQRTYFVKPPAPGQPNVFTCAVTGMVLLNGKLPGAKNIHLRGAYKLSDETHVATTADGVIRINGKQIVREAPGERPFQPKPFDVDISEFAGQNVLIEFIPDGVYLAAPAEAEWRDPEIVVAR